MLRASRAIQEYAHLACTGDLLLRVPDSALAQRSQRFSAGRITRLTTLVSASGLPDCVCENRAALRIATAQPMHFQPFC